jgi:hypothetical protein
MTHRFCMDCRIKSGNDDNIKPKNQARCALFSEKHAARKVLIHRHKCEASDFAAAMTITAPSRSLEGTSTGDSQLMERVRFLRAGLVTPLPGGPGLRVPYVHRCGWGLIFRALFWPTEWTVMPKLFHCFPVSATYLKPR